MNKRFFTMLGTLIQGRVSVGGAAVTTSKVALTVATRYALQRRQFEGARILRRPRPRPCCSTTASTSAGCSP